MQKLSLKSARRSISNWWTTRYVYKLAKRATFETLSPDSVLQSLNRLSCHDVFEDPRIASIQVIQRRAIAKSLLSIWTLAAEQAKHSNPSCFKWRRAMALANQLRRALATQEFRRAANY